MVVLGARHVRDGNSIVLHAGVSSDLADKIVGGRDLGIVARVGLVIVDGSTELAKVAKGGSQ